MKSVAKGQPPHNGRILRQARLAVGLSQAELGRLTSYSAASISRFETGDRPLTDVAILRAFAAALSIPPAVFGLAQEIEPNPREGSDRARQSMVMVSDTATRDGGESDVQRRELLAGLLGLTGAGLLGAGVTSSEATNRGPFIGQIEAALVRPSSARPSDLRGLTQSLIQARSLFEQCRYRDLGQVLPGLIASATAVRDDSTGRVSEVASRLMADGYRLAAELCVKAGDDPLSLLAADRARTAAALSGEPVAIAASARSAAIALRRLGHRDGAIQLLVGTAGLLEVDCAAPSAQMLGTYSSLLCTAAYSAAQDQRRSTALDLIAEAERAAGRPGRSSGDRATVAARNVAVYRVGIHTALGEPEVSLRHLARVNVAALPTPERRSRVLIDAARTWAAHGRPDRTYTCLRAAEREAPEDVRRPSVSVLVSKLLYEPGPQPDGLRAFARRVGAI